jgi:uncharacterized damage-inducible protein DinB
MTDDLTIAAARANIGESLDELRKAVAELSVEQLNTRPVGETSNPLGVIVVHALASTRSWLALAIGAPLPDRDRSSEFRTVVEDHASFLALVDAQRAAIAALLDGAGAFDPARTRVATWRTGADADEVVTAAWALQHALAHLGEHVGHAQLTHDLFLTAG